MGNHTFYIYQEINKKNELGAEPDYPDKCPLCGAGIEDKNFTHYDGPVYKCGGQYTWKSQIQNHTNKWWGACPVNREKARKERGRVCDGCGEKRLEGTGFPITTFGWTCNSCGHNHKPLRRCSLMGDLI